MFVFFFCKIHQFIWNNLPNPSTELFLFILTRVSQINAWLLDNTAVFNYFSNFSIMGKTGRAVHETNRASALFNSMLDNTSYR